MLLGLDTTSHWMHLALVSRHGVWTRREALLKGQGTSEVLVPVLDALLAQAGASPKELAGVAACVGPGGFAALRVGVAFAEGLALTGLPTWGFTAFELRARALREAGVTGAVALVLDGQRGDAFLQIWDATGPLGAPRCLPLAQLPEAVGAHRWFAPEAFVEKAEAALGRPPVDLAPEAVLTGLSALTRECATREPEAPLHPLYLRATDAEVNFPQAAAHLDDAHRLGRLR
ncbi:MAG TPA: tRNA (adenosine(37)-N6)-threonylcarbamoyltransferase complex dimerization subunit type 1 TsaB [Holophagaceae bacterium]|nr:tRNA (adenosine(37)-N6)-threonylcarbamoyltransferase complex dimerization subunit type 1 TsaB [Holophagaceae bacterium]